VVALMGLAIPVSACATSFQTTQPFKTAQGNKQTCTDLASFIAWTQRWTTGGPTAEAYNRKAAELGRALKVSGPAARSRVLTEEAAALRAAYVADNHPALANQLNHMDETCAKLGFSPLGQGSEAVFWDQ